jgi:hypothetical protein
MGMPANVTGMCPMLLTRDGLPSGIPVQVSKNWHWAEEKVHTPSSTWFCLPRTSTYFRVAYGFYGTLPSASHAQLSLWGYGTNLPSGRWDRIADRLLGRNVLHRHGIFLWGRRSNNRCPWSHDGQQTRAKVELDALCFGVAIGSVHMLLAVEETVCEPRQSGLCIAHGPCLSNVRFYGYYGDRAVAFEVGISDVCVQMTTAVHFCNLSIKS